MFQKIINLWIGFVFLTGSAGAISLQMEGGDRPEREPRAAPQVDAVDPMEGLRRPLRLTSGEAVQNAAAPDITLGEPGLSFSFRQRFGVSESPYLVDTAHLNDAWGIFIDGSDSVYVTEAEGARLLRYDSDGDNTLAIGRAGMNYNDVDNFSWPRDVAVDGSGNIWVVDDSRAVQFDSTGSFLQQFPEGDDYCTPDNDSFCGPYGIAFDSTGRMFIADSENHRVQVFTFVAGEPVYQATIGESFVPDDDNSHFNYPVRVAIDSLDRVYVVDSENHRVQRCQFGVAWTCSTFHGTGVDGDGDDQLAWPQGIWIEGSDVFIADSDNVRIKKCGVANPLGDCPTLIPDLAYPVDVAVDSAGAVYVVENSNSFTIGKNDATGNFIEVFAGTHRVPYLTDNTRINGPGGVAVAANGDLYVMEWRGHRLLKLNATGTRLWTVGEPGISQRDDTHFGNMRGSPAVDALGRVYVPDTNRHRVQIYNAAGTFFNRIGTSYQAGCDNTHLNNPNGVAISPLNGDIFVVDRENHRVQVFTSGRVYKGTLGDPLCNPGAANNRLDWPHGVAVDRLGNIYVADRGNHRVQKFNSSLTYVKTFGQPGVFHDNYGVTADPIGVAVDAAGRVYVLEIGNRRVQVFDAAGAFLTAFGQRWGSGSAQMRSPQGIAVDAAGCVYVAERDNHRVQKFCPGTPFWVQHNLSGFGDRYNMGIISLGEFEEILYAGTYNESGTGAHLYRSTDGRSWTQVFSNGLGDPTNIGIDDLEEFGDYLYLGTVNWDYANDVSNGAQIWRSDDGLAWSDVTPPGLDENDAEALAFETFGTQLYMGTWASYTSPGEGGEIWRTSDGTSGDWAKVVDNGKGNVNNDGVISFAEHNGKLYAGTSNFIEGAEVWVSEDGVTWGLPVASGGFGDVYNVMAAAMKSFGGWLYVGTAQSTTSDNPGAELWRCQVCTGSDWQMVAKTPNPNNRTFISLIEYQSRMYLVASNADTGVQVWRSADGLNWERVNESGFGSAANRTANYNNSAAVFNDMLYLGIFNFQNGGSIWMYLPWQMHLPLALRR